jgi:ribosomal protein S18 acetylase RimI-like enzyme
VGSIGRLAPDLVDATIELWQEVGLTRPWNDPRADVERALRGPSSTVLAGIEGRALVGTAVVGHDGHRGWVYYVAVSPRVRGRGWGRALMEACEAWLADRDVPKVNLMVRGDNDEARGFYAALGYVVDDVVVLSRRLEDPAAGA